jgi:hypothetical protein
MKLNLRTNRLEEGSALAYCLWTSMLVGLGAFSLLDLSNYRIRAAHRRVNYNEAFYHAENALNWAAKYIGENASPAGSFNWKASTLPIPYLNTLSDTATSTAIEDVGVVITAGTNGTAKVFTVKASAKVGDNVRTLVATVKKDPPSQVFDYEYFLNNWGWWWGSSITGSGDNRSNWDFDFRSNPTVNGHVIAAGQISSANVPIDPFNPSAVPLAGLAKSDPITYLKDASERLTMPNLKDLSDYASQAIAKGGTLVAGSTTISGVHTNASKPGLYLVGTAASPITINGPVVIPGDVIISGVIKGQGTLYVGGNLYVAGNVTYANGPDFSTPPETMASAARDSWVASAVAAKKDLIAFAVRESVFGGDVNSSAWKSACFDPADYGLKNVGGEASLGADGIRGTGDDGIPFRDTNGDGVPDSAWYDADGDGVIDSNYNYSNIQMTDGKAALVQGYPVDADGNRLSYSSVGSNNFNRLDGVYYCNHAIAMRAALNDFVGNGAVICRDEAIVFNGSLKFNYDSRINSRYADDPNRVIDLGLPVANKVALLSLQEAAPGTADYGVGLSTSSTSTP